MQFKSTFHKAQAIFLLALSTFVLKFGKLFLKGGCNRFRSLNLRAELHERFNF